MYSQKSKIIKNNRINQVIYPINNLKRLKTATYFEIAETLYFYLYVEIYLYKYKQQTREITEQITTLYSPKKSWQGMFEKCTGVRKKRDISNKFRRKKNLKTQKTSNWYQVRAVASSC